MKKRGGDHRRPETIQYYMVIDANTGEIIDDNANSISAVARAMGYSVSKRRGCASAEIRRKIAEGNGIVTNRKGTFKVIEL